MPGWLDATLAILTAVAGIALGWRYERRLHRRFVAAARGDRRRAIATTAALHLAVLAAYAVPGLVALALADAADEAWAAAPVVVPATALLLVPCFAFLPSETQPRIVVDDLVEAGATRPVARAIAATSLPFVFAELGVAAAAVIATFFA